ncbi:MAG TPA: hypothetical protein VD704_14100 [Gaiellaceae bacterium]|nr:hypothetical protein [Gaiellaceae bacterium]
MERLSALGRGAQLMLLGGVLLVLDSFFAWQEVELLDIAVASANAWHGFWGWAMGLLALALVAWLVLRLLQVELTLPVSDALLGAALGGLVFLSALLKNLTDDYSTFWSYLGVGLAALVAVGAWLELQEPGGVETLGTEASGSGGPGGSGGGAATHPTAEPEAAPAAPKPAPPKPAAPLEPEPLPPRGDRST